MIKKVYNEYGLGVADWCRATGMCRALLAGYTTAVMLGAVYVIAVPATAHAVIKNGISKLKTHKN